MSDKRMLIITIGLMLVTLLVLFTSFVFAEIPIYCPKCKTHIYNYVKDEIPKGERLNSEDFNPANDTIPKPKKSDLIICPIDHAPLNGWEYYAKIQHYKSFTMAYPAVSLLTKDKDGKWVWLPFDMPQLNFNEDKNE